MKVDRDILLIVLFEATADKRMMPKVHVNNLTQIRLTGVWPAAGSLRACEYSPDGNMG